MYYFSFMSLGLRGSREVFFSIVWMLWNVCGVCVLLPIRSSELRLSLLSESSSAPSMLLALNVSTRLSSPSSRNHADTSSSDQSLTVSLEWPGHFLPAIHSNRKWWIWPYRECNLCDLLLQRHSEEESVMTASDKQRHCRGDLIPVLWNGVNAKGHMKSL